MLPFFYDYVHAKNLWDQLTSSRDIDDQRILQSDWLKVFYVIMKKNNRFFTGLCRIMKNTDMHHV